MCFDTEISWSYRLHSFMKPSLVVWKMERLLYEPNDHSNFGRFFMFSGASKKPHKPWASILLYITDHIAEIVVDF